MKISDVVTEDIARMIDIEALAMLSEELAEIPYTEIDIFWAAFAAIIEAFAYEQNLIVEDGPYGPTSLTIFAEDDPMWD